MTTHPTALADQLRAASADANARIRRIADHDPTITYRADTSPGWLRALFQQHLTALETGQGRVCPHLGPAPQVIHVFAWRPGWLLCPACQRLAEPTGIERFTCDTCRRHARQLHPGVAALGPILFGYARCRTCHTAA
ncbi:MAG: hypothetical protein QOE51_406 [Actinoplanes sp.]|jgi:hypothetical protein|nr:hypothetical protein [Actinoplanes sp.]